MNEIQMNSFDYNLLDNNTASFLRKKEDNMREVVGKAYTDLGRELKEAQDELSKKGYGCFEQWYSSLGFKKQTVYKLIQRFDLIVHNVDEQKMLEELPVSLTYEIAKPSTNEELKQKVLEGDVRTLKEYKQLEKALREAEEAKKKAEQQAEQARRSEEIALRSLEEAENKPPKVIERVIEDETKIQKLQYEISKLQGTLRSAEEEKEQLEQKIKIEQQDAETYRQLKQDLESLKDRKESIIRQIDNAGTIGKFITRVEESFEKDLAPIKYTRAIQELNDSEAVIQALDGIVSRVEKWCQEIRSVMPRENYIDAEVIEYE